MTIEDRHQDVSVTSPGDAVVVIPLSPELHITQTRTMRVPGNETTLELRRCRLTVWHGPERMNLRSHVLTFSEGQEILTQHLPARAQGEQKAVPFSFSSDEAR